LLKRALLPLVFLLLLAPAHATATTILTPAQLVARGIDPMMFSMVTFSEDGNMLLGIERTKDLKLKVQGISHLLRIFQFRAGKLVRLDTVPLPTSAFEQLSLNPPGSKAVVIGEGGSKFIEVDLSARTARVFWTHKRGTAGFRSEMVAWWYNGVCYLLGYLHDTQDNVIFDGVVRLNPSNRGHEIFEAGLDKRPVQRALGALLFEMYVNEREAFFGVTRRSDLVEVYHYLNGKLTKLDEALAIGGIASAPSRILYAARYVNGRRDLVLRDMALKKTWHLGKDNLPYNYLFLSGDGKTAVLTLMDFRNNTMSYFYARESDGFKVKPLAPLQDVKPGTLRLASGGRVFAYYGPSGLIYGTIP